MNAIMAQSPPFADCQWISISVVEGWRTVWARRATLSAAYLALHPETDVAEWKRVEAERLIQEARKYVIAA